MLAFNNQLSLMFTLAVTTIQGTFHLLWWNMVSVPWMDCVTALDLFLQVLVVTGMSKLPQFKISEATRSWKKLAYVKLCFGS